MDPRNQYLLAAEVGCTPRTVRRWAADASSVAKATAYALGLAREKLGMPDPHHVKPDGETSTEGAA